jgi:hypothetical protein
MEDKRGIKRERSPSVEGRPLLNDAKTPLVPSGSPLPPGSLSEVSSCRRCSPVFKQGSALGMTPVSGPSSLVVDTSRNDGKIIIIDDSTVVKKSPYVMQRPNCMTISPAIDRSHDEDC